MQTFLPYPDFERSARVLDAKRLGKQRVEVIQIVRALTVPGYAWANHPAVLMWKGCEEALGLYGAICCRAWTDLGFGDTCAGTITLDLGAVGVTVERTQDELAAVDALPSWLGNSDLHRSHQSALARKDPALYGGLFPDVPTDLPYLWPVRSAKVIADEQRKAESAARRVEQAAAKAQRDAEQASARAEREAERARRRRSAAAKKAWQTRRASQSPARAAQPMVREPVSREM